MRCIGITKNHTRCKNRTAFLFCRKHIFQPFAFAFTILSIIGIFAGAYQDFLKPLRSFAKELFAPTTKISLVLEQDRVKQPNWSTSETADELSDLITISDNSGFSRSYEFYHVGKSQKINDYPSTSFSFENAIPTLAKSAIIDIDGDGDDEALIWLENKAYPLSLHRDQMIDFVLIESNGHIAAKTPMPHTYADFAVHNDNPYSAYQVPAVLLDKISNQRLAISFCNLSQVIYNNGKPFLVFGWILDNSCFACEHVFQIDIFQYDGTKLQIVNHFPLFLYSGDTTTDDDFWGYSKNVGKAMRFVG